MEEKTDRLNKLSLLNEELERAVNEKDRENDKLSMTLRELQQVRSADRLNLCFQLVSSTMLTSCALTES